MDAINYLKLEHSRFRKALATIKNTSNEKLKKKRFDVFCQELTRHEKMEEKIWYPILRKNPALRDIIKHLVSEEKSAAKAMLTFKKVHFEFMWKLRFYKFKHDVEHHAKEEEQVLFPKVRRLLDKSLLIELGNQMRRFKKTS